MSGRSKEETEGVTLLGNQKVKYADNYAPEVLKHLLTNIRTMTILSNLTALNLQVFVL